MSILGAVFHSARVILETLTPLSIATGHSDGVFDMSLVRDANGLPTIPGSSLAGVLRHLYWQEYGQDEMETLFGFQQAQTAHVDNGAPSSLQVSYGFIQDSRGRAVQGLCTGKSRKDIESDPILKVALEMETTPVTRDRVRLNHRGTSVDRGKFDRTVLPAGYRFSIELSLWSEQVNDQRWEKLLGLLSHPFFRLGGATRAGLGNVKVVTMYEMITDLRKGEERKHFTNMSRNINQLEGFTERSITAGGIKATSFLTATIRLKPNSFWRIGQGDTPTLTKDKPADLLPKLEQRLLWKNGQAEPAAAELLIPASSVKGALSHRIAFHANRLNQRWADDESIDDYDKSEHCETIKTLFGFSRDDSNNQSGQVGKVAIDDAYLVFTSSDLQVLMHNAIDRFSGNVREHMLFSEEMVWGKAIELKLTLNTTGVDDTAKLALDKSLADLCRGRLSLGAGVSKGHGLFTGAIEWSDKGQWINKGATA